MQTTTHIFGGPNDHLHIINVPGIDTLLAGSVRIDAMVDGRMRMPAADVFRSGTAPCPHAELPRNFPGEFTDDGWNFIVRTFLVRTPQTTVLIDAGVGPAGTPLANYMGAPGDLPCHLAALGVDPSEIEHVVFTHFHDDHVGWAVADDNDRLSRFPNALMYINPKDLNAALSGEAGYYSERLFRPLSANGRLRLTASDTPIAPGVRIEQSNGHTPGHQSVRVSAEPYDIRFVGDLIHFSYQMVSPFPSGPFDADPVAAQTARGKVLASAGKNEIIASPHLADAFTFVGGVN